jgi:ribosome-associated heat shock protein Hsp15
VTAERQRIDKWLWFARLVRTRSRAARLVSEGHVRHNRVKVAKPSHEVAVGDVLTVALYGRIKVLRICGLAARRGPAPEACRLYEDLAMPNPDGELAQKVDATGGRTC